MGCPQPSGNLGCTWPLGSSLSQPFLPWEIVLRGISNHNRNKDGWGWGRIIPGWWQMMRKVCVWCLWPPGSHRPLYKTGPLQGVWISALCLRANEWYVFAELCERFLMVLRVPTGVYSCGAALPPDKRGWLRSSEFPFGNSQRVCLGHYRCPKFSQCNTCPPTCCELSKELRKSWRDLPSCLCSETKCIVLRRKGAMLMRSLVGKIPGGKNVTLPEWKGILLAARSFYS